MIQITIGWFWFEMMTMWALGICSASVYWTARRKRELGAKDKS